MDPSCLVSTVQASGGGVMVWGIFSWYTLGPLVPIEHCLNATAWVLFADHVRPFITTVYPSSDATSSRIMHHVTKLKSSQTGFLNMTISLYFTLEFTLLKWPPQSPDFNPIEHLWDVVEREIRIMDVQPKICRNCVMLSCQYGPKYLRNVSNALLNICHEVLRQFWRQKGVQPATSKVYLIKWPVSVYINIRRVCSNYRGITLLSLPGKVYARVLERRIWPIVEPRIQEEQCGFRSGRGTLDQLYTLSRVLEGSWEFAQPIHMCFVDLEKAFNCVPRGDPVEGTPGVWGPGSFAKGCPVPVRQEQKLGSPYRQ